MNRILCFFLFFFLAFETFGMKRHVPSMYSTIQTALNNCATGDTVLVQPGTYVGNIIWPNIANIKLFSAGDSSNTVLSANNSGRVLLFSNTYNVDTNTIVRGFKITKGQSTLGRGGGLHIQGCALKLQAVSIVENHVGSFYKGRAGGNSGHSDGAGIYMVGNSLDLGIYFVIENSTIIANQIDSSAWGYGAGIYITETHAIFRNVKINSNKTYSNSWSHGSGLYASESTLVFENVEISRNSNDTGAVWNYGGGVYLLNCDSQLRNFTCISNTLSSGGTWYHGGGIYLNGGSTSIVNGLIAQNSFGNNAQYYGGGGIYQRDYAFSQSTLNVVNLTVADNRRMNSQVIAGSGLYSEGVFNAKNCIFYNPNSGSEILTSSNSNALINYSNVRGSYIGSGNIDVLPNFASSNDYHLISSSACINVGTSFGAPSYDLDNSPRPFGGAFDMGCYEYYPNLGTNKISNSMLEFVNYPNPTTGEMTVKFYVNNGEVVKTRIINMAGNEVYNVEILASYGENIYFLDLTELPKGIYVCQLTCNSMVGITKIVKN